MSEISSWTGSCLKIVRRLIPDWGTTYGPAGDGPFLAVKILHGSSDELLPTTPIPIESFGGPLFLSHGTADRVWSVEMTKRLVARLHAAGRQPEVHLYEEAGSYS